MPSFKTCFILYFHFFLNKEYYFDFPVFTTTFSFLKYMVGLISLLYRSHLVKLTMKRHFRPFEEHRYYFEVILLWCCILLQNFPSFSLQKFSIDNFIPPTIFPLLFLMTWTSVTWVNISVLNSSQYYHFIYDFIYISDISRQFHKYSKFLLYFSLWHFIMVLKYYYILQCASLHLMCLATWLISLIAFLDDIVPIIALRLPRTWGYRLALRASISTSPHSCHASAYAYWIYSILYAMKMRSSNLQHSHY